MTPQISVILPVYNGEQYLRECLDSIRAQTLENFELLCVNDGSTDSTRLILSEYQKKDPRIRIIDQENSGYGRAVNHGLEEARGKYIAVVEADDYIPKHMLYVLYGTAETEKADVVKGDYFTFTGDGANRRFTYMQTAPDRRFYGRILDSTCTTALFYAVQMTWEGIYRREFLLQHNIRHNESPGASFQDNGFWFQVFTWAKQVYFIKAPLYYYRVDNAAASTKQNDLKKLRQMFGEYDFILEFLNKNPEEKVRLYPTYFHFRFVNLVSRFFCASEDGRLEIARSIHAELCQAVQIPEFSWTLFGPTMRSYLKKLLENPDAFASTPPADLNELSWKEVSLRPHAECLNCNLTIPAQAVLPYLESLSLTHDY